MVSNSIFVHGFDDELKGVLADRAYQKRIPLSSYCFKLIQMGLELEYNSEYEVKQQTNEVKQQQMPQRSVKLDEEAQEESLQRDKEVEPDIIERRSVKFDEVEQPTPQIKEQRTVKFDDTTPSFMRDVRKSFKLD